MSTDSATKRKRVYDDADRDMDVIETVPQAVRPDSRTRTLFSRQRGSSSGSIAAFYMFGVPLPPQAGPGERLKGCPVVNLSDSAADVEIVLDAAYRPRRVNFRNHYMRDVAEYHTTYLCGSQRAIADQATLSARSFA